MQSATAVGEIRRFNRFYTNIIGVIDRHILRSPYSLTEVRILFEVFHDPACNAREIRKFLAVDEGYLSRTIDALVKKGLLKRTRSPEDGRVFLLSLSSKGRREFLRLNSSAESAIESMIDHLSEQDISEVIEKMRKIQELLSREEENHEDTI
jgi:DNA-binding MarR family transcriptional regulator